MSDKVKIIHEDGTIAENVRVYDKGVWIFYGEKYDRLYCAEKGWREYKPEPKDVTGECLIHHEDRRRLVIQPHLVVDLPPGHYWKEEQARIITEKGGLSLGPLHSVLRIMKDGG